MPGYTGTNSATGDNTAYGYGYKPDRIGIRGAGSVSWAALTAAYGTDPGNPSLPYYPPSLATSCAIVGGTYSSATNTCIGICAGGYSYDATSGQCNKACATGTYSSSTDTCNNCTSVSGTYNTTTLMCTNTQACATGSTYYAATTSCQSCPASGYATGTYSGAATCTNSCPTGTSGRYVLLSERPQRNRDELLCLRVHHQWCGDGLLSDQLARAFHQRDELLSVRVHD